MQKQFSGSFRREIPFLLDQTAIMLIDKVTAGMSADG